MRTRKNRNNSRKNKKGGFFFRSPKVMTSSECDVNNLTTLSNNTLENMNLNYSKCCPKEFMGRKNSSPYCKQLDLNIQAKRKNNGLIEKVPKQMEGYYGEDVDEKRPSEIQRTMEDDNFLVTDPNYNISYDTNYPAPNYVPPKKPWYKFWGGKKTRKHKKRYHKRNTYRRK